MDAGIEIVLKTVALSAYCFIVLMGEVIGIPLGFWLIFAVFDFGNITQFVAVLGVLGIALNFTKYARARKIRILSFALMLMPIAMRIIAVSLEKFNYFSFQIPLFIFLITYLVLIFKPKLHISN